MDKNSLIKRVNNFIFVDEIEYNENNNPVLYYFGTTVIEKELNFVENQIINIISNLNAKSFHANRNYKKNKTDYKLMDKMSDVIIKNRLVIFCFSFSKKSLDDKRLEVLKDINTKGWNLDINNYRAVALYLFFHVLNTYLVDLNIKPFYRLIVAEDFIKKYNQIEFIGGVIKNIEKVCFVSAKQAPLVNLCDHLGYLFGKCLREINDFKNIENLIPNKKYSQITNHALNLFIYLSKFKFFHYRNIWEWLEKENNN
jgi:hypothetical protein